MPPETKTKKHGTFPLMYATPRDQMSLADIRNVAKNEPEKFANLTAQAIEEGDLTLSKIKDWKGLLSALMGVDVPVSMEVFEGERRTISVGAFPMLTGNLSIAAINAAYEAVPTIGQDLVTEMDSNKDIQIVANIHALGHSMERVMEGEEDYPLVGAMEEWVAIEGRPNGLRSSIPAKLIEQNDTAGIEARLTAPGEIAAEMIEELTLRRVTDADGSNTDTSAEPTVYKPSGKGTQLYDVTADKPGTRAPSGTRVTTNALVDESDLENVRAVLAAMKNERGKRIQIWRNSSMILLVPDALVPVADRILRSEFTPGIENESSPWGLRGRYRPNLKTSPKLDDLSTTAWYMGDFKRQFKRKWRLRMELVTLNMDEQTFLKSRVAFQSRIAWDVEVGAIDYVFVVQSLDGTTYTPA